MAENMTCKIVSVQGVVFEGEVRSVRAPASEGEVCILKDHISFVTSLKAGALTLETTEGNRSFAVPSGVLEIVKNRVTVVTPAVE